MYSIDKRLGELLTDSEYGYCVPRFQRPISWDDEHVNKLQQDIENNILNKSDNTYFMGMIVVQEKEHERKIWDGQQRLFTLISMICAGRDLLFEHGFDDEAEALERTYIFRGRKADWAPVILELGEIDKSEFANDILPRIGSPDRKNSSGTSESKVYDIYENMKSWLLHLSKSNGHESIQSIREIVVEIVSKLQLIVAITDSRSDAFKMFETLNDRGLPLSAADLIKNYVFSEMPSAQHVSLLAEWNEMVNAIGRDKITEYIRHFYVSRYGIIPETDLFDAIKDRSEKPEIEISQLVNDMMNCHQTYIQLSREHETYWNNRELSSHLAVLRDLETTQWIPLLLAMENVGYPEEDLARITKSLEKIIIRDFVIGGRRYSDFYKKFGDMAISVWVANKDDKKITDDLVKQLESFMRDDKSIFQRNFNDHSKLTIKKAKVILGRMEAHCSDKLYLDAEKVDVDYIYPKKDVSGWPTIEEKSYFERTDRTKLGNIILLPQKISRSVKTKKFAEKKEEYGTALTSRMNTTVLKADEWDRKAFTARQKELFKIALEIWPKSGEN